MAEELGKIEKPPAASFKRGRKLFFVPLVFGHPAPPEGYLEKFNKYWEQVEKQLAELVLKLGEVSRLYHEMVAEPGEEGIEAIQELNEKSHKIVRYYLENK